jgi:hypothetical protein
MLNWANRLAAIGLILMVGAAPLCACPYMAAPSPAPHTPACCRQKPEAPVMPPAGSCEHCPIMNPAHAVLDQSAAVPPLHWIARILPGTTPGPVAGVLYCPPAPTESPPPVSADLFHLPCLLTL